MPVCLSGPRVLGSALLTEIRENSGRHPAIGTGPPKPVAKGSGAFHFPAAAGRMIL